MGADGATEKGMERQEFGCLVRTDCSSYNIRSSRGCLGMMPCDWMWQAIGGNCREKVMGTLGGTRPQRDEEKLNQNMITYLAEMLYKAEIRGHEL